MFTFPPHFHRTTSRYRKRQWLSRCSLRAHRDSMNSGEKLFMTAFSGSGGTITPGRCCLRVSRNHVKSE